MGWGNTKHKHRLGREWMEMESSPEEKDCGVLVDEKLNLAHPRKPRAGACGNWAVNPGPKLFPAA